MSASVVTPSVVDLIGDTPLLQLRSLSRATRCRILAKAEFANPGGSSKDRVAAAIVREAEATGALLGLGRLQEGLQARVRLKRAHAPVLLGPLQRPHHGGALQTAGRLPRAAYHGESGS